MTLNGAITELVLLSEHPMMPVIFKPGIQKVIETISELEAQPEQHWILVKERNPIEYDNSIAYVSKDYIQYMYKLLKDNDADVSVCGVQIVNFENKKYKTEQTEVNVYSTEKAFENLKFDGIEPYFLDKANTFEPATAFPSLS